MVNVLSCTFFMHVTKRIREPSTRGRERSDSESESGARVSYGSTDCLRHVPPCLITYYINVL